LHPTRELFRVARVGEIRQREQHVMAIDRSGRILIVDDYSRMLRIIRGLLRQLGYDQVEEASDGASALDKLRQKRFSLVISDWNIQPMSGLELLRQVRADPALATLPFIMITAEARAAKIAEAQQAGVSDYIIKPFGAEALSLKIAAAVGG
jgi:two-component system, chemotaxis family, chemotaxis protein CheY